MVLGSGRVARRRCLPRISHHQDAASGWEVGILHHFMAPDPVEGDILPSTSSAKQIALAARFSSSSCLILLNMRRLFLKLSLGASAILGLFGQGKAPEPKASKMSADDLKKLADSKKKFFFLDVREPKEIEDLGTMKGFVNIPLGQLEQRLSEIPKDSLVVTA